MQIRKLAFAAIACALFACSLGAPVCAEELKAGDLVITQAWARATPKGAKIGGEYLTIAGPADGRLGRYRRQRAGP